MRLKRFYCCLFSYTRVQVKPYLPSGFLQQDAAEYRSVQLPQRPVRLRENARRSWLAVHERQVPEARFDRVRWLVRMDQHTCKMDRVLNMMQADEDIQKPEVYFATNAEVVTTQTHTVPTL